VNGSLGKVTEFLTTSEALKRNISIATLDKKGNKDDAEDFEPHPRHLMPLQEHVFGKDQFWPLVCFTNGMELLCAPVEFSVEGLVGNVEAHRLQVPLILAWALSIHKSQGQTLSRVKVDLDRIFEKGQGEHCQLQRMSTQVSSFIQHMLPCLERPLWKHWRLLTFSHQSECWYSIEPRTETDHRSRVMAHPRVISWQETWMPRQDKSAHFSNQDEDTENGSY
jgi:hypothetical protein